MTLPAGARLGPYEIVALIGAGGMGEVYRARDTRLDRPVAIKVLLLDSIDSADARQRFEREAKTVSRLSHPHICQLHDVGTENGTAFLVMELLDGETLAARLTKGPLPLDVTLRYAIAMADALEAAHRSGIVHRDVKPSNVMLPKSGLKLLDFGLAKDAPALAASPTLTATPITAAGVAAGTVQYMAPEVLEGHPADHRSDLYALGAVIYEMATGRRVFDGGKEALAPASFDRIVRGCLMRDPDDRWQSARDVQLLLADVRNESATPPTETSARGRTVSAAGWAIALVATAFAVFLFVRPRPHLDGDPAPLIRFGVPPPPGGAFWDNIENDPLAMAPDGSQLAFVATDAGRVTRVYVRSLTNVEATAVAGTEGATTVIWSPDSKSIAFYAGGKIKRIDLPSGGAISLCDYQGSGVTATWGQNGQILFTSVTGEAIYRVPASGGTPVVEVKPDPARGERRTVFPWYLPDGRRFLYSARLRDSSARVMLAEAGKPPREVLSVVSNVQYVEPGYLVFVREGTLVGQRFDPDRAEVTGTPFSIAGPIRYFYSTSAARFATAPGGAVVFHAAFDLERMVWIDRTGHEAGTVSDTGIYSNLRISPDGRRLLFSRSQPQVMTADLWVTDFERGSDQRLTSDPTSEVNGTWDTDGRAVFFSADRGGPPHVFRKDLRTGVESEMTPASVLQMAEAVTPDGKLAFTVRTANNIDLWTMPVGGGERSPLLQTPFSESQVRFSPDGRAMAFAANESGRYEVYLSPYPATGEKTLVSASGATFPRWSRDGRELFFVSADRRLMSVPVRTVPSIQVGQPVSLFTLPGRRNWKDFDVSMDGKRFLAIVTDVLGDEQPLTVVTNWKADLPR